MAHKDWYVALVEGGTPFDPAAHRRRDLPVKRVSLSGTEEGEVDRLGLVCIRRTDAPILEPGAPRWVHLSRELADGSLKHMGYGYVIPTPQREDDEFETYEFNLSPMDWADRKLAAAVQMKILPFFDDTTVAPDARFDVTEILDGYSSVPHCHRSTHAVSFAEITGAGAQIIEAPAPWMPGPQVKVIGVPIAGVDIDATAEWTQSRDGDFDATEMVEQAFDRKRLSTLTPEEFERAWFKPNSDVNGDSGWKVLEATLVRRFDLPVVDFPVLAGPFRGPSSTYNFVQDQQLTNPIAKEMSFERAWYRTSLKLGWTIRQKRIERIFASVNNGGQMWAGGERKTLSIRLEDVSRDDITPYWRPGGKYKAGQLWKVGDTVYSCLADHQATFSFAQDVLGTGPQGGIVQRWAEAIGDQSPLGNRAASTYWISTRGEATLQNLLLKARAMIVHSQRCVEIKFRHLLTDELLDLTTAHRCRLRAPADMLRGAPAGDGVVVAKVYDYEIVSDQDDEYVEVTLRASIGSGDVWTGGNGLVTQTGEGWDRILYEGYAGQVPEDLPALEAAVSVTNDVPKQISTIQAQDFDPTADPPRKDSQQNDPKNIVKTVPTSVAVYLTQISGRPDMAHEIVVPVVAPFAGQMQWRLAA